MILQVKIFIGSLLAKRKSLRRIVLFIFCLMIVLIIISPRIPYAQTSQPWPWPLKGDNFQVTLDQGNDFAPSVASDGDFYLVVWARNTADKGYDIYGARIDKNGNRMDDGEIVICNAPDDQISPSVSWNGENFIVVWEDKRNGKRWDIFGALVSPEGRVLKEIQVSIGKSTYDQAVPVIVFGKESHLVVWQGKRNSKIWNIYFTIVSSNGNVLLNNPVQLAPSLRDQAFPAVAFDGEDYLVVWQDKQNGKTWDIYGARVSAAGDTVDEPFQLTPTGNGGFDRWSPVLSWNGNYFLAVWEAAQPSGSSFLGRRVFPQADGGFITDAKDLAIQPDASSKAFPYILRDGVNFLLVWEQDPTGDSKIYGASIQAGYRKFSVSAPVSISTPGEMANPSAPAAALLGDEALVVWQGEPVPGKGSKIFGQIIARPVTATSGGSNPINGE